MGSAAQVIVAFVMIAIGFPLFVDKVGYMITTPRDYYDLPFDAGVAAVFDVAILTAAAFVLPFALVMALVGVAANFFQVGFLVSGESVKPELKKLNPAQGIKKIFSIKNLMEFVKSIIKIFFLGILLVLVIEQGIRPMLLAPLCGVICEADVLGQLLKNVAIYSSVAFIIIAFADFVFQRRQHTKSLMMTKDEVKREFKEMEGNQEIKGRRKQLHRQMAMGQMEQAVKKSSVVVTNPTHIAVALYYEADETPLPVVKAKGQNLIAERIVKIARDNDIPIMQNIPLARSLHDQAQVNHYVPSDLLKPVAEVLRAVHQLLAARGS